MLEQLIIFAQEKWELIAGGSISIVSIWGAIKAFGKLPQKVLGILGIGEEDVTNLTSKVDNIESVISKPIDTEDAIKQRILAYKDKLESTILSDERKEEYLLELKIQADKLKENYGTIINIPNTIKDV